MNALLSFKRNGKTDNAANVIAKAADPLMDSKVMLDEIPEEHFSTLKFLDIKREEEAKRVAETPVIAPKAASAIVPVARTRNTAETKPSRMQLFKDRVGFEKQDCITLPFAASGRAATQAARINLASLHHTAGQISPLRTLLNSGFAAAACAEMNAPSVVASHPQENEAIATRMASDIASEITSEHLRLATHASFCLTRSHDSLQAVLQNYLVDSDSSKPLLLQLPATDQFDFCAGHGDLFIQAAPLAVHRLTETDTSRTLVIGSAARLALDSLTAAHPLRQRSCDTAAFTDWFTEDNLACDTGVSPIETFVQAELLHTQQQVQRTLVQLRRLAAHLQAHCPQLQPLEALHHTAQADAWANQYGQAAPASLYRLLECQLNADPASTVYAFFIENPTRLPAFNAIAWPHMPAGLQLLQTLAQLAHVQQHTASGCTEDVHHADKLLEQLAVLDMLMRDPSAQRNATQRETDVSILRTAAGRDALLAEIANRFQTLENQLHNAGLLQATPHPEEEVCNAGKHA